MIPHAVEPSRRGSRLRCKTRDTVLEVDANLGGRIVEYSLRGRNALFEGDRDGGNHGSTFWTSPQRDWGWPPPIELDREPYAVIPAEGAIVLESRRSRALRVSVGKRFTMNDDGSVALEYRIRNESETPIPLAPWEVTRVPRCGTSFFSRSESLRPSAEFPSPALIESNGLVWLDHRASAPGDRKLLAAGSAAWLAHAANGLLFVKEFDRVPNGREAPGEAQIEVFVSGSAPYVELEQQGAYTELQPGAALVWSVRWRLVDAPSSFSVPDPKLRERVRELVGENFG